MSKCTVFSFLACLNALAVLLIPAVAKAQICTEIGCENGVVFNLDHDKEWKRGKYVIYASMERKTYACKGELPLKTCDDGPSFICSSPLLSVEESGCALPEDQHGLSRIKVNGAPHKLIIRMSYNGGPMVTKTLYPRYETAQPNGPACGPVCRSATYRLLLAE